MQTAEKSKLTYLALLVLQIAGASVLVLVGVPAFNALTHRLGEQLSDESSSDLLIACTVVVMQTMYWYRIKRLAIPFRASSKVVSHVFLFFGRLSFIFGGALFSLVFFRHLPELGVTIDVGIFAMRGVVFTMALFALFCLSLEIERLGHAFDSAFKS